jgi:hypothetical protein
MLLQIAYAKPYSSPRSCIYRNGSYAAAGVSTTSAWISRSTYPCRNDIAPQAPVASTERSLVAEGEEP